MKFWWDLHQPTDSATLKPLFPLLSITRSISLQYILDHNGRWKLFPQYITLLNVPLLILSASRRNSTPYYYNLSIMFKCWDVFLRIIQRRHISFQTCLKRFPRNAYILSRQIKIFRLRIKQTLWGDYDTTLNCAREEFPKSPIIRS